MNFIYLFVYESDEDYLHCRVNMKQILAQISFPKKNSINLQYLFGVMIFQTAKPILVYLVEML